MSVFCSSQAGDFIH
ncbi:mCG1041737 [Mus musculus]|nr:mCG1041737 [Mus musculus]